MPEPALRARDLGYRYPDAAAEALSGVDLEVAPGEFVVLAGLSGSGKSTLLRAACGLVPHFHGGEISGELEAAGLVVGEHGPAELAARVGYISQEPESQVVSTTVGAELELPLELRDETPAARARAVEEVALALGLPHLLERTTDTLSGGEQQRVALAAALVPRPALLLLDEPTSQLDPVAGDELIWLLRKLNEDWGVAVILCEHRLERCLGAADRVVAMESGGIAFDGPPGRFLEWALGSEPALATPAARLFELAGIRPLPRGVREARQRLGQRREEEGSRGEAAAEERGEARRPPGEPAAVRARGLWVELPAHDGPREVLRGPDLELRQGERVALMGRNGAGKSTLLRALAGLIEPVRGSIDPGRGVALLPQSPGDLFVRERVGDELPGEPGRRALAVVGLEHAREADPRDLSGGERQRLALAIVIAGRAEAGAPGAVLLDEPTRGMDRARKADLTRLGAELAGAGSAVVIATHDVEFAAEFAQRVVILAAGEVIADGAATELLSGGWFFSTEVARVLDIPGAITPEAGAEALAAEATGRLAGRR